MANTISRLMLDVLKPHQPSIDVLGAELMKLEFVEGAKIRVEELDEKTASLRIIVQGEDLDLKIITDKLESMNCAVHSVDEVWCGNYSEPPK